MPEAHQVRGAQAIPKCININNTCIYSDNKNYDMPPQILFSPIQNSPPKNVCLRHYLEPPDYKAVEG